MQVLDKGIVDLVDFMGSDQSVVQAARISNGAVMPDWRGAPDEKLIKFLAKNHHMTPFEHAVFKFYVKAPLFVVREWQRHRTFSYNELSGRYKQLKPEFYVPLRVRVPSETNKQSSVEVDDIYLSGYMVGRLIGSYQKSYEAYTDLIDKGVTREIARLTLPLATYTEFYVTGNFRNWMHWYLLRSSEDAQFEIREYAKAVGESLFEKMPISFTALIQSDDMLQ